jgi:hypothetical protein
MMGAFPRSPWTNVASDFPRSPWTNDDTINQSTKVMKFTCNIKKMKYCSNIRKQIMKFQKFTCCSNKLLLYLTFTYRATAGAFPRSPWTDVAVDIRRSPWTEVDTINQSTKVMNITCNIKKMKYCSNIIN